MEKEALARYENFLKNFTKKNGKKLGEKTIHGVLTLAKFIEESKESESLEILKKRYEPYTSKRNYPIATYSLWLYLKSIGYEDKFIKELIAFKRRNISALTDEEKLAQSVLSKREILFLVDKIPHERNKLLVKLLYDTASRVSEIINLRLKDLDLETKEVQVMGKGRKPRTVYFQSSTADLLKKYLAENEIQNPNELIFKIKPVTVWYNFKRYGKELLQRDLHPHMLRHSRLQHLADDGVDSFNIKALAGHADIATSQIYIKASKYQGRLAFEKGGDIWKNQENL